MSGLLETAVTRTAAAIWSRLPPVPDPMRWQVEHMHSAAFVILLSREERRLVLASDVDELISGQAVLRDVSGGCELVGAVVIGAHPGALEEACTTAFLLALSHLVVES